MAQNATQTGQLPETSWLWRRLVTFGVLIVAHVLIGFAVWWLKDAGSLKWISLGLIGECVVVYMTYLTASSVSEWARLAGAIAPGMKIGLGGVSTATDPATVTTTTTAPNVSTTTTAPANAAKVPQHIEQEPSP
jgi:hypothetical protein